MLHGNASLIRFRPFSHDQLECGLSDWHRHGPLDPGSRSVKTPAFSYLSASPTFDDRTRRLHQIAGVHNDATRLPQHPETRETRFTGCPPISVTCIKPPSCRGFPTMRNVIYPDWCECQLWRCGVDGCTPGILWITDPTYAATIRSEHVRKWPHQCRNPLQCCIFGLPVVVAAEDCAGFGIVAITHQADRGCGPGTLQLPRRDGKR